VRGAHLYVAVDSLLAHSEPLVLACELAVHRAAVWYMASQFTQSRKVAHLEQALRQLLGLLAQHEVPRRLLPAAPVHVHLAHVAVDLRKEGIVNAHADAARTLQRAAVARGAVVLSIRHDLTLFLQNS
jgi:hypothetical protein